MPAIAEISPLLVAYLGVGLAVGAFLYRLRKRSAGGSEEQPGAVGILDGLQLRGVRASLFERRLLPAWQKAAERVGLTQVAESGDPSPGLRGRWARLEVRMEGYLDDGRQGAHLVIGGFGHGEPGLLLRRKTALEPRSEPGDVLTGDPVFDNEVRVQGNAQLALAVLDAAVRPRLAELLRGHVESPGRAPVTVSALTFEASVLEVWIEKSGLVARAEKLSDQLAGVLAGVIEVARRLVAPLDLAERLAENLRREPETGVRLQIVQRLGELPQELAAHKALRAARGDRSDEVRLQAALAVGEEGVETLLVLVRKSKDDGTAARAVAALGERLPPAEAEAALLRALETGLGATARACLEALGRRGGPELERLLLRALAGDDPVVAVFAAAALGRVGTVEAVAALREEASIWRPELRKAARQAIAEIQARLTGAQAGQLSLAASEAGALSLAQNEPGSLSLAETEPGRLSVHPAAPAQPSPGEAEATEAAPESSGRQEGREWA